MKHKKLSSIEGLAMLASVCALVFSIVIGTGIDKAISGSFSLPSERARQKEEMRERKIKQEKEEVRKETEKDAEEEKKSQRYSGSSHYSRPTESQSEKMIQPGLPTYRGERVVHISDLKKNNAYYPTPAFGRVSFVTKNLDNLALWIEDVNTGEEIMVSISNESIVENPDREKLAYEVSSSHEPIYFYLTRYTSGEIGVLKIFRENEVAPN